MCYHARLQERGDYEKNVVEQFNLPLACEGVDRFLDEIRWLVLFNFVTNVTKVYLFLLTGV